MGCTYVKDFDFGPQKVQVKAYARGGPVKKDCGCMAKGGTVKDPDTGISYSSKEALAKHQAQETPAMQRYEKRTGKEATRKFVPVAPKDPLIAKKSK